ncbi:MAG: DNA-binding response OmpR family regulator [Glaciecola sp.]|jgi:DNA-binding response OmpR family regulator
MDLADITKMRILIVDNVASAKQHLTAPLEQIGFVDLQYVESTSRALLAIEKLPFDLIICAYSIQTEHDGLYFYEQILQSKLLNHDTGFIFTSHETSFEIVQSIVDLPPDDFIAKPVNAEKLSKRINRLFRRKQRMSQACEYIEQQKYNAALTEVNKLLSYQNNRDIFSVVLKTKGELFLLAKEYADALDFYQSMLKIQPFSWAEIGRVKSLISLDQDAEAEKEILNLACKRDTKTAAYELLAMLNLKHDKFEDALESALMASKLSPKSFQRQNTVRLLAKLSHDHETEFDIAKRMLAFAKNSVKESPQLYKNAVRAGIDYAMTAEPQQLQDVVNATKQFLTQLKKQFSVEEHADEVKVMQARIMYLQNENDKALQIVDQFNRDNSLMSDEALVDKAKALHEIGLKDDANALYKVLDDRAQTRNDYIDDQLSDLSLFSKLVHKEKQEKEQITLNPKELNKAGVQAFNTGNFSKAFEVFSQASALMPKNTAIALNMLHVISKLEVGNTISELSTQIGRCIDVLDLKNLSFEQSQKYRKLRNILNV